MDSEWIRNSIQKEGFTCTEAIIIFGDIGIGIVIFVTGAVIGDVGLQISCILEPEQEMSWRENVSCDVSSVLVVSENGSG